MSGSTSQHTAEQLSGFDTATVLSDWKAIIAPAIDTLTRLAGTTEDEFLQIGSQMQDFYLRSSEISSMANRLVETVSGEQAHSIIERLRQMMSEMEAYLASAREQSRDSCETLERILELLDQVSHPLEGFQKMYKTLRMLSISTKIESARIGEKGLGFVTLAMDVEKLSHQVNDKSASILANRLALSEMIGENLRIVRSAESAQDLEVGSVLISTSASLEELVSVNDSCTRFGSLVSSVSSEVSANIGEVVSSMQAHDITRQQVEHIVEALERLGNDLRSYGDEGGQERRRSLIKETGDVCELQAAQLRHGTAELHDAVCSIVGNLRDVARKQSMMAEQTLTATGVGDSTGHSFVDRISRGMSAVTGVLAKCTQTDHELSATMQKVADTIGEIAGFVTDIEGIGSEIDLIALNSQIKAAHTGEEGAALGVLAEAIKRLSLEAVIQTEAVSRTLLEVNASTEHLFHDVEQDVETSASRITVMEHDLQELLGALGSMNADLLVLLSGLGERVNSLTVDIERATSSINVHEQTSAMAATVVAGLDGIVAQSRAMEPASTEFKENLRHMEERYTMQSERHIHETIARKRGGGSAESMVVVQQDVAATGSDSEFGDNVDLF